MMVTGTYKIACNYFPSISMPIVFDHAMAPLFAQDLRQWGFSILIVMFALVNRSARPS